MTNWKRLYTDASMMLDKYQNDVVPNLRKQLENRVEVVRCKDCVHMKNQFNARYCEVWTMFNGMGDDGFCNYGERKSNEKT